MYFISIYAAFTIFTFSVIPFILYNCMFLYLCFLYLFFKCYLHKPRLLLGINDVSTQVVCYVSALIKRYLLSEKYRVKLKHRPDKILIHRKYFSDIPLGLVVLFEIIGSHAVSIKSEFSCHIYRTIKMIFLRYDDNLFCAENFFCPIHGIIS